MSIETDQVLELHRLTLAVLACQLDLAISEMALLDFQASRCARSDELSYEQNKARARYDSLCRVWLKQTGTHYVKHS